jgi:hypothetical protein
MKERLNLAALTGTMEELPRGDMHEVKGGVAPILIPISYTFTHLVCQVKQATCDCGHIFCTIGLWLGPDPVFGPGPI